MPSTRHFSGEMAADLYGLSRWGKGYLAIGRDGHLRVTPGKDPSRFIDVPGMVEELGRRGYKTPLLLRFPQLLGAQIQALGGAFQSAIQETGYPESFHPVFPLKVNQQRGVVEPLLQAGWKHRLGLEVGSLAELLAAMVLSAAPGSLTVCNGYKDSGYLAAAAMAAKLGRSVIVVLEKPFEVDQYLELAQREEPPPLGFRIRLQSRGSGLWEKSGGPASKFGLSTSELLEALDRLGRAGLDGRIVMLHFHIGSQLTEIRKIKQAVREGARVHAKVVKRGIALKYLDVGGGLGVDYDGSRTSSDASMNYTIQEYANNVIYSVQEVCEQEAVPPPRIICESGRMLTAYHSMLVTDVRGVIPGFGGGTVPVSNPSHQVIKDLAAVAREINVKNYREYYHDALEYRDQMHSLFDLGIISLEDRARGEELFWNVARQTVRYARTARFMAEEFRELVGKLHEKYICNFSVFQSVPDHWALDALFPIMPIHRLDEEPSRKASLVDITCDSDGAVEKFVDLKDIKAALDLHPPRPGEPYWIAILLIGAYQDTMGDLHNLFGRAHVADLLLDPRGESVIRELKAGDTTGDSLGQFGFSEPFLMDRLNSVLRERVNRELISRQEADDLMAAYRNHLEAYTYLD
ncbi:MAG: biosynthetic arginine decarboxylase [Acidobacteriota bacterium]